MDQEVRKILNNHEERLRKLEKLLPKESSVKTIPSIEVDVTGLTFIKKLDSVLDKCLALLNHIFDKDPRHLGLTPDEMVPVFREKFGMPLPLKSVSSRLGEAAGTYVSRQKERRGRTMRYRYQILPKGQEYIKKVMEQLSKVEGNR